MIHSSLVIYMNAHGFGEADVCTQKNLDPAMQRIHHHTPIFSGRQP